MNFRTLEELEDVLYYEFAWRRDELREISRDFDPRRATINGGRVRAGITVLYAHWEGGIKTMADAYIGYLKNQRASYRELCSGILGLLLRARLGELAESNRFRRNKQICDDILGQLDQRATFPVGLSVDTGSNLSSSRIVDVLASIGIEESLFITKHVLIDSLLNVRNDAAHGDNVRMRRDDFKRFYSPILEALELFRDRLVTAANERHFLANP